MHAGVGRPCRLSFSSFPSFRIPVCSVFAMCVVCVVCVVCAGVLRVRGVCRVRGVRGELTHSTKKSTSGTPTSKKTSDSASSSKVCRKKVKLKISETNFCKSYGPASEWGSMPDPPITTLYPWNDFFVPNAVRKQIQI